MAKHNNDEQRLIPLVCARGRETFGLSLWANNTKHALRIAARLLNGSGYAAHPVKG